MAIVQNAFLIPGSDQKPILTDITYDNEAGQRPAVIYVHGFCGFKDWGNFNLIADLFTRSGFTFIKFNFSHNGTSPEHPEDFVDPEAFALNNYTRELYDLEQVINWCLNPANPCSAYIHPEKIALLGHSMGGGISILKAAQNKNIKALCTWASISVCKTPWRNWPQEKLDEWEKTGAQYYLNSRTNQQLPMYYQLYTDYYTHQEELDIMKAASSLSIPFLICHGTQDTSVTIDNAYLLQQAAPHSRLFTVYSDHVFGRKHPWTSVILPLPAQEVVEECIRFFRAHL